MHTSIEIVTPAACMDLTVLETVKMELGIADTDTSKDDQLSVLIKQASGIVADYCNTVFGAEDVIETFWTDYPSERVRSFLLSRLPVISIDSVFVDSSEIDASQYRVGADGHLHMLDPAGQFCWWNWTSTAVVSYTAGYVLLDNLPYGVERAALSLIKEYYRGIGRDPRVRSEDIPGLRSVSYQVGSLGDAGKLPPEVEALLAPHKRLVFA